MLNACIYLSLYKTNIINPTNPLLRTAGPQPKPLKPLPQPLQPPLPNLPPPSPINNLSILFIPPINKPQQNLHEHRRKNTPNQNPNHYKITLAILLPARRLIITLPPRIKRIRSQDGSQIAQSRYNSRRSRNAHLAVPWLEDFCRPSHCYWHCGA